MARPTLREQCAALQDEVERLTRENADLKHENRYLSHVLDVAYHQPQIVSQWDASADRAPAGDITCTGPQDGRWYVHATPPAPYQPYRPVGGVS